MNNNLTLFLDNLVVSTDWQDELSINSSAQKFLDKFNDDNPSIETQLSTSLYDVFYEYLYAMSDALTDRFRENRINGISFWITVKTLFSNYYEGKSLILMFGNSIITAQISRGFNDAAYFEYSEKKTVNEDFLTGAINALLSIHDFTFGMENRYSLNVKVDEICEMIMKVLFSNTFRQFDIAMYNSTKAIKVFSAFYEQFCHSRIIIQCYGKELAKIALDIAEKSNADESTFIGYSKTILKYCKN